MARLIDLDELEHRCSNPEYTLYNGDMRAEWIEHCIATAPTVEAEPVKHGRWIGVQFDEFFECSVCGDLTDWDGYDYCPNCGAKMDAKEVEENDT